MVHSIALGWDTVKPVCNDRLGGDGALLEARCGARSRRPPRAGDVSASRASRRSRSSTRMRSSTATRREAGALALRATRGRQLRERGHRVVAAVDPGTAADAARAGRRVARAHAPLSGV